MLMLQGHTRMAWADTGLFSAPTTVNRTCFAVARGAGESYGPVLPIYSPKMGQSTVPKFTEKEFAMVASRKVRKVVCCVVRLPEHPESPRCHSRTEEASPRLSSTRPSDLLPWADPYIAQLVRNLQNEIRQERSTPTEPTETVSPLESVAPSCQESSQRWTRPAPGERRWAFLDNQKGTRVQRSGFRFSGQR